MNEEISLDSRYNRTINKISPTEFDVTISAILTGLGAEKYIEIFRKRNIGQYTLAEFTDEDLKKIGVDDPNIRTKLLEEVKNLPVYEESSNQLSKSNASFDPNIVLDILEESSQHLYRIYLSMLANTLALKKTKNISDCLLHEDKYASDIALSTISEINNILNSMDITLHTQIKVKSIESRKRRNKKIIVGTFGSATIAVLAVLFVKSLHQLRLTV